MNGLKIGDRLQVSNDGYGNPVRHFDRKTKTYTDELQWFEVTGFNEGGLSLKPVWDGPCPDHLIALG